MHFPGGIALYVYVLMSWLLSRRLILYNVRAQTLLLELPAELFLPLSFDILLPTD